MDVGMYVFGMCLVTMNHSSSEFHSTTPGTAPPATTKGMGLGLASQRASRCCSYTYWYANEIKWQTSRL
jgi:hypothetical protein